MKAFAMPALLLSVAVFAALSGCGRHDSDAKAGADDKGAKVSISVDSDDDKSGTDGKVAISGDSDSGKFELKLPGGIDARVSVPAGMGDKTHFDIDGVGLYPGAKVKSVNVNAGGDAAPKVVIGFAAPGDAAAVADWYQQQFEAKKVAATRQGDTLSGKTEDGDDFTLALTAASPGAHGQLTIIDRKHE